MFDSIIAHFGMDNSRFKRGMKENESRLGKFSGSMKAVKAGIAGIVGGLAIGQIKAFVDELDKIGKTADKLGLTTDELQKLRFAGEQTGVAANTMDMAFQRFSRRLAEARQGTGEAKGAISELGIEILDANGLARSNVEVFRDVADAIAGIEDPTDRTRLAFKFFDSEGVALINTLKGGSAGLDEFGEKLEAVNGVIDEEAIRKAEALNDNLNVLSKTVKGTLADSYMLGVKGFELFFEDSFRRLALLGLAQERASSKDLERQEKAIAESEKNLAKLRQAKADEEARAANEAKEIAESVAEFNKKKAEERKKLTALVYKAEAQLARNIEKFAFDQLSVTEKRVHLERELGKARKQAETSVGLTSVNARIRELELTKELVKAEEQITKEIESRKRDLESVEKDLADALKRQDKERQNMAKHAREEALAAIEKAKAEERSLKSLQSQAVERAAAAGGRESGKSDRVQELRERAQREEDQGRFTRAARTTERADKLEADVTERRRARLFDEAQRAQRLGDTGKVERLREQAERAGYIDSEGRDSRRTVGAETKEAVENERLKLAEYAKLQAEETAELRSEVKRLADRIGAEIDA